VEARVAPDRLGYYTVGGKPKRYYTKFEALEQAIKTGSPLSFHWDDDFWSAQNWLHPTPTSLFELYRRRALQLREKYQHLIVMYSGGADSWNALRAFEAAGCPPDEILCWHQEGLEPNRDAVLHAEIFKVAIPSAQEYVKRNPRTKLTIVDGRDALAGMRWDHDSMLLHVTGGSASFNGALQMGYAAVLEALKHGDRTAIVTGNDKVLLSVRGGRYCLHFTEITAYKVRCACSLGAAPVDLELFYTTPDMPEISINQAHELKTRLDTLPAGWQDPWISRENRKSRFANFITAKSGALVHTRTINAWYFGWDPATFSVGKPGGSHFMTDSDRHVARFKTEELVQRWATLARKQYAWFSQVGPQHRNPWNRTFGAGKPMMATRPYFIEL
jgi:hypothetical protein